MANNKKSVAAKGSGKGMPDPYSATKGATIAASKKQSSRPKKKQSRYDKTTYGSKTFKYN